MNPEKDTEELKKNIQAFMEQEEAGPLTLKELVHAFDVPRAERDRFKRIVKNMVSEGGGKDREGDIFIANRKLSGAMHNDTVVARVEGIKMGARGERREGSIIRVISRANKTIVGRFEC